MNIAEGKQIRLQLDNVSAEDARFISELIALFADPAKKQDLDDLKALERTIGYCDGELRLEWRVMKN